MKGEKSMKRIIEIEKEELPVFKKVVSKLSEDSKTVITLKQVIERPEEYDFIDIKQKVLTARPIFHINDKYFYMLLSNMKASEIAEIKLMFNSVLSRGTANFERGKVNDYIFIIDIVSEEIEKNKGYIISGVQPIFISSENNDVTCVFEAQDVRFSLDEISNYDIETEIYDREQSENEVYKNLQVGSEIIEEEEDSEEESEFLSDDFLE